MYYLVIPAYEPDEKLLHLLDEIRVRLTCRVVIVNDGSSPACDPIFEQAQKQAIVLEHPKNLGKGEALKTAFRYLNELDTNAVVVTADADRQHSVTDIDRVAHTAKNLPRRLILGVRQFSDDIPLRSRFGNKVTRFLFKLQTGVAVSDTQTGLRSFHSQLLPFMLDVEGERYEYEINMLTKACRDLAITEIPIQTIYIDDNASSHFRPIQDSLKIYKNLFKFALASLGSAVIDYGIYALTLFLLTAAPTGLRLVLANTIARLSSSICNFNLNKILVFNNKESRTKTGAGYFSLAIVLFACDTALLYLFHELLGVNLYFVKILVGVLLFFVSWFVQKHFIFRERKQFSHEFY